eukprot:m.76821 g.76821  ORF g.76821 m.76821 type:complete len:467 (+) comp24937_c0_seq1:149-1549(+)
MFFVAYLNARSQACTFVLIILPWMLFGLFGTQVFQHEYYKQPHVQLDHALKKTVNLQQTSASKNVRVENPFKYFQLQEPAENLDNQNNLLLNENPIETSTAPTTTVSAQLDDPALDDGKFDQRLGDYFQQESISRLFSSMKSLLHMNSNTLSPISNTTGVMTVVFTSDMLEITQNLLCSITALSSNARPYLQVIAFSTPCEDLGNSLDGLPRAMCTRIDTADIAPRKTNGEVEYADERYAFMVRRKLVLFGLVLDLARIIGVDWVLFSDADVVVKKDPFQYLRERVNGVSTPKLTAPTNISFYFMTNDRLGPRCDRLVPTKKSLVNSGFFFTRTDEIGTLVMREALDVLEKGKSYDGGDQGAIQTSLNSQSVVRHEMLPCKLFPNGNVYFGHAASSPNATYAIHANWVVKLQDKVKCLRASGHWYLTPNEIDAPKRGCVMPESTQWKSSMAKVGVVENCWIDITNY